MHEIEQEAAFEQGVIHPVHVLSHERATRRLVEQAGPLAHHHAQIRDRALIDEVGIVPGHPIEVSPGRLQPAAVLAHPVLAADNVAIRRHSRGERLVKPHLFLFPGLVDVTPAGRAGGPRPRYVGGHLALLDGVAHAALQGASPDRRIVSAASLVVALEPLAELAELHQAGRAAYAAAKIAEIEIRRLLLLAMESYSFHR